MEAFLTTSTGGAGGLFCFYNFSLKSHTNAWVIIWPRSVCGFLLVGGDVVFSLRE